MDAIGYFANALSALPAFLGIARRYLMAFVASLVMEVPVFRRMVVIVATVGLTLVPSAPRAGSPVATVALQSVEQATLGEADVSARQNARVDELSGETASAIYSPFAGGPIAENPSRRAAPKDSSAREPTLTMTLSATVAGAVALLWLLQRS